MFWLPLVAPLTTGTLSKPMGFFIGAATNKVDRKGRVSVPFSFRKAIADSGVQGFVVFPSPSRKNLEACSYERYAELMEDLDFLEPSDPRRTKLSQRLVSDAHEMMLDTEGRIGLPSGFVAMCGIDNKASFVGKAHHFEIWGPDQYEGQAAKNREIEDGEDVSLPWLKAQAKLARSGEGGA